MTYDEFLDKWFGPPKGPLELESQRWCPEPPWAEFWHESYGWIWPMVAMGYCAGRYWQKEIEKGVLKCLSTDTTS